MGSMLLRKEASWLFYVSNLPFRIHGGPKLYTWGPKWGEPVGRNEKR